MHRSAYRPNGRHFLPWHRHSLLAVGGLLLVTGLAWLAVHYTVGAGAGELPHPSEAWLIRLHGLAAYAGLFMLGIVAAVHIPHGWHVSGQQRWAPQRRTGLLLCGLAALLSLSGYLLYYFAPEWLRPGLGGAHAAAGVAMAAGLAAHRRGAARHRRLA